jgi:flagellar basal-body rod protein FlgC
MSGLMDVLSIGGSGMNAAMTQLNVTANNIANLNTPGYQSQGVDLVSLSQGGVGVGGITTDTTPGPVDPTGKEQSNVDLASQSIDLMREKTLYDANAAVVRTGNQMLGSLLDMFDHDHDKNGPDSMDSTDSTN